MRFNKTKAFLFSTNLLQNKLPKYANASFFDNDDRLQSRALQVVVENSPHCINGI